MILKLKKNLSKAAVLAAATLTLAGCSIFSDDEQIYAELEPIDEKLNINIEWDTSVGDGIGSFYSRLNPVFVGDTLIAADREGIVRAMNPDDGSRIWQVDLRKAAGDGDSGWNLFSGGESMRLSGGLSEGNGNVFVGTENGYVIALDAENGDIVWQAEVLGEAIADPAIGDGVVVVHTTAGKLIGLDAETGDEIWSFDQEVPALSLRGLSAPVIASGGAVFGTNTGKLTVAILENGQQAWEARIAQASGSTELERLVDLDSKPVILGQIIYTIAYNGQLAAVDVQSGRIIWQREYSSYENLAVTTTEIFTTDSRSHVFGLERRSGTEKWSNGDLYYRELTAPVVYKDHVVVGDMEGYLHFLNRATGTIEGRLEVGADGAYVEPIVRDDALFVQFRDGTVAKITAQAK